MSRSSSSSLASWQTTPSLPPEASSDSDSDSDSTYSPPTAASNDEDAPLFIPRSLLLEEARDLRIDTVQIYLLSEGREIEDEDESEEEYGPFALVIAIVSALSVLVLVALVLTAYSRLCLGPHPTHAIATFDHNSTLPTIRPSDLAAVQALSFELGAFWSHYIISPPLGSRHTIEKYSKALRTYSTMRKSLRRLPVRDVYRARLWTTVSQAIYPEQGREDEFSMANATDLLDRIDNWAKKELTLWDLYLSGLPLLHQDSISRMREINVAILDLATQAYARQNTSSYPSMKECQMEWTSKESETIAHARDEYAVVTFLALFSSSFEPAVRIRHAQLEQSAQERLVFMQRISECDEMNGQCTSEYLMPLVKEFLRDWSLKFNSLSNERRVEVRTVKLAAAEWVLGHMHPQESPSGGGDGGRPQSLRQQEGSPWRAWWMGMRLRIWSSPSCHYSPFSEPSSSSLSPSLQSLLDHIWWNPEKGAASWHWEGSSPPSLFDPYGRLSMIADNLLYQGIDCTVTSSADEIIVQKEGTKIVTDFLNVEKFRYAMPPRDDGKDLRRDWQAMFLKGVKKREREMEMEIP